MKIFIAFLLFGIHYQSFAYEAFPINFEQAKKAGMLQVSVETKLNKNIQRKTSMTQWVESQIEMMSLANDWIDKQKELAANPRSNTWMEAIRLVRWSNSSWKCWLGSVNALDIKRDTARSYENAAMDRIAGAIWQAANKDGKLTKSMEDEVNLFVFVDTMAKIAQERRDSEGLRDLLLIPNEEACSISLRNGKW